MTAVLRLRLCARRLFSEMVTLLRTMMIACGRPSRTTSLRITILVHQAVLLANAPQRPHAPETVHDPTCFDFFHISYHNIGSVAKFYDTALHLYDRVVGPYGQGYRIKWLLLKQLQSSQKLDCRTKRMRMRRRKSWKDMTAYHDRYHCAGPCKN